MVETSDAAALPQASRWRGNWLRAAITLFALGATLGVALDVMHVWTRTTEYPDPEIFGIKWWVFPLFSSAAITFGLARPFWERVLGWRTPAPAWPNVVAGMALFVAAYLCSGMLPFSSPGKFAVLAVCAAASFALDRTLLGALLGVSAAVLGTGFEALLIAGGGFRYVAPDFLGVAMWLPLLYVTVGISVGNLGKRLVEG